MLKLLFASLLIVPIAFGQTTLTTTQIAKRVSPSVVVIQGKTESGEVLGSGFIVSKDGKIVTNLHVIRDMKTASVQLANGETFDSVSVLAIDERRDLAIVQSAGMDLPALGLGNSDFLTVGEPVVVVGSPQGLEGTVTAGILSSVRNIGEGFKVLQTDAAVNPGNSGGPLVNNKGQAIGVVSFKLRSAEGLNFAIPINYVRELLNNLHEPISLEQMRSRLTTTSTGSERSSRVSLKETLDWLKEKIPLGALHYQRRTSGLVASYVEQPTMSGSSASCTGVFGRTVTMTLPDRPDAPSPFITGTAQYTVPLGALTDSLIVRMENVWTGVLSGTSAISDNDAPLPNFISGDRWSYRVILMSKTKNITIATTTTDVKHGRVDNSVSWDGVYLTFNDEALARSVRDAFLRAADICRNSTVPTAPQE